MEDDEIIEFPQSAPTDCGVQDCTAVYRERRKEKTNFTYTELHTPISYFDCTEMEEEDQSELVKDSLENQFSYCPYKDQFEKEFFKKHFGGCEKEKVRSCPSCFIEISRAPSTVPITTTRVTYNTYLNKSKAYSAEDAAEMLKSKYEIRFSFKSNLLFSESCRECSTILGFFAEDSADHFLFNIL